MSINKVVISGNLTRDPELRSSQSGTNLLTFGVAVNDRRRNPQSGEWEDYANFVDCVLFGNRADYMSRNLHKGTKVAIEGKLRYSSWERDGQRRSKIEIVVDDIDFISPRRDGAAPQQGGYNQGQQGGYNQGGYNQGGYGQGQQGGYNQGGQGGYNQGGQGNQGGYQQNEGYAASTPQSYGSPAPQAPSGAPSMPGGQQTGGQQNHTFGSSGSNAGQQGASQPPAGVPNDDMYGDEDIPF